MKHRALPALLATLSLSFLLGAAMPASAQDDASVSADQAVLDLLAEDLDASMQAWPTWATQRGDRRFDALMADVSPEARAARLAATQDRLKRLLEIDRAALTPANVLNAELFEHELKERIDGARFKGYQTPVDHQGGPHTSLPQMPDRITFTSDQHYADYAKRLAAIPAYLDQVTANMREGLEEGRTPPQVVMGNTAEQALSQATDALLADPSEHALYGPFEGRPASDALATQVRASLQADVIPAFRRFAEFLRDVYVPGCRQTIAASDGPDGAEFYAHRLRHFTTTDRSAQAIHELGLNEVARIRAEMFQVIARSDFPQKEGLSADENFAAFTEYLRTDPRFYHDTAEALLQGYRDVCKRMDAELPRLFGKLPRLPYGVREMPAFIAENAPTAYYYRGSPRNGVAGNFIANTYALDSRPTYEMVPLALHEAVPGHHLQIALAQELEEEGLPEWRTVTNYTVFVEGWGLYSERLGLEVGGEPGSRGFYEDPYDDFGRLSYEMWRALRLVVDPGLHALGWTREQAIAFMLANSALTRTNVESEVDRYIAWPGQAVAYKTGELKIRKLRAAAEEALGERFDVRAFHDTVLGAGAVPLSVLERRVNDWIAEAGR
ncbi:DUF885 domain-containing protein [Planctomycetota bacterium]|nr:DUF885 domain-containing protein [Planctomycetota bacterium]